MTSAELDAIEKRVNAATPTHCREAERVDEESGLICYEVHLWSTAHDWETVHFHDADVRRAKAEAELYAHCYDDLRKLTAFARKHL